ncbi:mannan endo-1,4-beta-mannosidase [Cellvibrio zantedeschiae]|uniref:Mannan endo-1,4-beta-mannosidase n=1 Tax=Cellvibrio zantedeschiae TaxID=1237077 RepID=A0ABQ3B5J8_9GAMM|nr:glycosyl hydrolase [Cellvibrio zantedeschiae]GGY74883.1 mannan endo-1,4-beta-mannosidase [Cellvibrio zantedeschiae]
MSTYTLADATAIPSDPKAIPAAKAVQAYLAALTNEKTSGVIAGQNIGHSDDISNTTGLSGFIPLITELENHTGELPGIVGVDYEHNHIATPDGLRRVNTYLIDYWNKGGLITINWSPQNPWWNDEAKVEQNPGKWTYTRSNGGDMSKVDLRELVNPKSPARVIWLRKLERIATALIELQNAGVVVLWRPMQEMNGNWFWWGIDCKPQDADSYIALWRDMYTYFTQTKGLHNLLWVFSPNQSPNLFERSIIKPPMYRYPGDSYVDIFAGTAYNNELVIKDYELFKQSGKPIAIAEFGPRAGETISRQGTLDTRLYQQNLQKDYPAIAYWVSWSSWSNGDGTQENQALVHNKNAKQLLTSAAVITRKGIDWKNYLTTK